MKHWSNARLCSCIWVVPTVVVNILYCNFLHILLGHEAFKTQPEGREEGLFVIAFTSARQNHVSG